jgi:hypothetical protein
VLLSLHQTQTVARGVRDGVEVDGRSTLTDPFSRLMVQVAQRLHIGEQAEFPVRDEGGVVITSSSNRADGGDVNARAVQQRANDPA